MEENPVDKAKKMMESIHSPVNSPVNSPEKYELKTPLKDRINDSIKSNREVPLGGLNLKPNTYEQIRTILKDGGMDSMSTSKALQRIWELLESVD